MHHFCGKVSHGLLGDDAAFTWGKGGFRLIDGNESFNTVRSRSSHEARASCIASSSR